MAKANKQQQRRAVVVAGARTPFVKAFAEYLKLDAAEEYGEALVGFFRRRGRRS